ncbi:unnamed protein product [Cylicocyclus nassatus]|uniref:CHK kinase-like domain-containing protein n=1 Tax=Cylicocyclus nassatus TaxID=53992 RepID=A0AA36GC63_CYLNA|nr:unnamed protein product [Cylicocyclus nassatus]
MNLYTLADGLGGTHVTWDDIEEDMQRVFDTAVTFGPYKSIRDIGNGRGFMSRILLINPDWKNIDKDLPRTFIVKIVSQLAMIELTSDIAKNKNIENRFDSVEMKDALEVKQKQIHNVECTIYSHIKKLPKGTIPCPEIYYMQKFTENNPLKGYLIMEHIKDLKPVHVYQNIPAKALKKALRAIAALEAMSLKFTVEERNELTDKVFTELWSQMLSKDVLGNMMNVLRATASEENTERIDRVEKALPDIVDIEKADHLPEKLGMRRVFCHGDLWTANMLWKESNGEMSVAALIDFQTAHMGCPAYDLVRLFSSCLSGKDRRLHWEELVEDFYVYLEEEVSDMKMPYTLEQLKESYRQYFPLGGFMVVICIGPFFEALCKNPDEEHMKKGMEVVTEKTECLLDDILYYHERNKEIEEKN